MTACERYGDMLSLSSVSVPSVKLQNGSMDLKNVNGTYMSKAVSSKCQFWANCPFKYRFYLSWKQSETHWAIFSTLTSLIQRPLRKPQRPREESVMRGQFERSAHTHEGGSARGIRHNSFLAVTEMLTPRVSAARLRQQEQVKPKGIMALITSPAHNSAHVSVR